MKKKILSMALIVALLMTMLLTLTACGEDSSKKKEEGTSAKEVIKAYEKNLNKLNASALAKQFDVKKLNKLLDEDYDKDDIEEALEEFFEEYDDEDDWYELTDTTKIKDIEDLEDADIYYDEDILEDCIDKYEVYLLDIEIDGDEEQDFIVINDGKIVYNMIIGYYLNSNNLEYDYDDDDDDYDYDYGYDDEDVEEFNEQFDGFEGDSVSGTKVKELLDTAIAVNEIGDDLVWIYYYGEEDDDYTGYNYSSDEIEAVKEKIESTHKYTVEYEYDSVGCVDDITIKY